MKGGGFASTPREIPSNFSAVVASMTISRTTWVSRYQKGTTSLNSNEAEMMGFWGWQWHQLNHTQTICTSLQTDNHTNTASLNFYRPDE